MRRALSTPESFGARWGRRAVTIPGYFVLAALSLALLPLLLPLALVADLARRTPLPLARTVLMLPWYFTLEAFGLLAAFALWLVRPLLGPQRFEHANFRLQCLWARSLFAGACRVLGMRVELAGEDALGPGSILLFLRHASVVDTLLPAVLVSSRTGRRLRYVMKRELLWDPCLDIVGQRLPNAFVRRGQSGSAAEIERVRELARDLGPRDGVMLFPEGTRFTPRKRQQVLARLAESAEPKHVERGRALQHVLPPRLGGVLALLEEAPGVDVAFCVHTGFERLRTLNDLWSGELVGRTIEVEFWRIPAAQIPGERAARVDWLFDQWTRVDEWLETRATEASKPS